MWVVRHLVSRNKIRYKDKSYDLDLTYIDRRIIAMGFPSEGFTSLYRNPLADVAKFLNEKHPSHYKVYNLSERRYNASAFSGPVEQYPFPNDHAPPFGLLLDILHSMHEWLSADPLNVVAVHCVAGIGRTGTIVSSLLLYECIEASADDALVHFGNVRTDSGVGVVHPSQIRYVFYAESHLSKSVAASTDPYTRELPPRMRIKSISFENISADEVGSYSLLILDSNFCTTFNSSSLPESLKVEERKITFIADSEVFDDFTIKLYRAQNLKRRPIEILRSSMNTSFIASSTVVIPKRLLDGPHDDFQDSGFAPDFQMVCLFSE